MDSREPAGLRIKTVSVTYEGKLNLGDYNSLAVGAQLWADVDAEQLEPTEALAYLRAMAQEEVRQQSGKARAVPARRALLAQYQRVSDMPVDVIVEDAEDGSVALYRVASRLSAADAESLREQGKDVAIALYRMAATQTEDKE